MELGFTFLRSKVGRRILTFFVISAVVPVTAFGTGITLEEKEKGGEENKKEEL